MAQIQLKCPNCRQDFEGETNENADPSARLKTKCPACGIAFFYKNDENPEESDREWGKSEPLPEDFEVILNMEMHSAFDIPGNRKYKDLSNGKTKSSAFASLRLFFRSLWNGIRLAVIMLIPFTWFGIAGLFLDGMPVYAKWITLWILPALLLVVAVVMAIRNGGNTRQANRCPHCGKFCSMAKIKEAPLVQSDLVPRPILSMTIMKCTRCGTEITRKEEYPSAFVTLSWCFSLLMLIVVYAMMISKVPGVISKLTVLFILMVTWGVFLFAPVKYSDPLRIVTPDE